MYQLLCSEPQGLTGVLPWGLSQATNATEGPARGESSPRPLTRLMKCVFGSRSPTIMTTWAHHRAAHNNDHPVQTNKNQEQDANHCSQCPNLEVIIPSCCHLLCIRSHYISTHSQGGKVAQTRRQMQEESVGDQFTRHLPTLESNNTTCWKDS